MNTATIIDTIIFPATYIYLYLTFYCPFLDFHYQTSLVLIKNSNYNKSTLNKKLFRINYFTSVRTLYQPFPFQN
jgi:hypothetical protein